MTKSIIHLLAGGPGSDHGHLTGLLREALSASGLVAPQIAYVGAASGDDAGFFRRLSTLLREAGAGDVVLARTCGRFADHAKAAKTILMHADAIFVSGGDVEEGMRVLMESGLIPVLQERFAAGVPFIGLSAGSIMLGRKWIAWDDPANDATARIFDCLGLAPLVCDTHAEDDDWSELHALLQRLEPGAVGYGITAPAMLRIYPDGHLEELGGKIVCLKHKREASVMPR